MTTSRMVVVLRSELGEQLSLAQKEAKKADVLVKEIEAVAKGGRMTKEVKAWVAANTKCRRLQNAIHALGALQLGDIEDKDI